MHKPCSKLTSLSGLLTINDYNRSFKSSEHINEKGVGHTAENYCTFVTFKREVNTKTSIIQMAKYRIVSCRIRQYKRRMRKESSLTF